MRCVYPFIAVDTLVIVAQELTYPGCNDEYQHLYVDYMRICRAMSHSGIHRKDEDMERYGDYSAAALAYSQTLRTHLRADNVSSSVRIHIHSFARH